jgi:hypothetical protein
VGLAWLALAPRALRAAPADSAAVGASRQDTVAVIGVAADAQARDSIGSFPPPRVRAWQVGLVRADRLEHASLSFALTSALTIVFRDRAAAAGTALAFGLGKELWDGRQGHFDPVDLAADAVGIGLASVLVAPRGP